MSKYFGLVFLFLIVNNIEINGQPIKLGVGFLYCFENSSFDTGVGVEPFAEYQITEKFSVRGVVGLHLSSFKGKYVMTGDSYRLTHYYGMVMYRPIKNDIEPFVGLGLGYYLPMDDGGGNSNTIDVYRVTSAAFDNNWGYNITAGADFFPGKTFHCMIELNYTIINTDYSYKLENELVYPAEKIKFKESINLSYFAAKLNFVFEL